MSGFTNIGEKCHFPADRKSILAYNEKSEVTSERCKGTRRELGTQQSRRSDIRQEGIEKAASNQVHGTTRKAKEDLFPQEV